MAKEDRPPRTFVFVARMEVEVRGDEDLDPDTFDSYLSLMLGVPDKSGPYGVERIDVRQYPDDDAIREIVEWMKREDST